MGERRKSAGRKQSADSGAPGAAETAVVVVETPKGSRNKYKLDEESRRMRLSKVMPEGMVFPFDFGFFPDTKSQDGDPLDVLILNDEPTFAGCQIDCRLIGTIKGRQTEKGKQKENDRIVAVAEASVLFAEVKEYSELGPSLLKQIEEFFVNYQKVRNIEYEIVAREGSRAAKQQLVAALQKKVA
jgi:inorganic pyrophosphatase